MLPAGGGGNAVEPHLVTPQVVTPRVVAPHVVEAPPAPSAPLGSPPADNPPAEARSAPAQPASGSGGSTDSFLIPVCNVENPCTQEQREIWEMAQRHRMEEEEERWGIYGGRTRRQVEAEMALLEEELRIRAQIRQFAGQLVCPLYDRALDGVATVDEALAAINEALAAAGQPNEFLQALESKLATMVVERNCFTTREP